MVAQADGSSQSESSEPISRRKLLRAGAAAAVSLAAEAVMPSGSGKTPGQAAAGELGEGMGEAVGRLNSGPTFLKARSLADYQANMQEFGGSLASPVEQLLATQPVHGPYQLDILVIGSGYGASICAARMAQKMGPDVRLAIMERGKEWVPGTFPDSRKFAGEEARFDPTCVIKNKIYNPLGLFSAARSDEVNVLSANGLGGGSLINANVAYRPDPETFATGRWPAALQDGRELAPYYDRALYELDPSWEPVANTRKSATMFESSERLAACGGMVEPANLTITRGPCDNPLPIYNRQGLRQRACVGCGDCTTGCNVGAKHTLAMNYLPLARRHGARIFTQCEAISIEPCGGYYRVHFKHYKGMVNPHVHTCHTVTARVVVLGAGSLGSTEVLLRSRADHNLSLSCALGKGWSANGDAIGFIRKIDDCTNIGGYGTYPIAHAPVGPTIQTNLTYPGRELSQRVLYQDGSVARAYANILGAVLRDEDFNSSMMLFAMGFDDAGGDVTIDSNGHARIRWPELKNSEYRQRVQDEFGRIAAAMGGSYRVLRLFGTQSVTVHPLGGCNMSDDPDRGVTTDRGHVWFPAGSAASGQPMVHGGLYVADASIFSGPIGVNPFLTISALSDRIAHYITVAPENADLFVA